MMRKNNTEGPRRPGRPRAFDRQTALRAAMKLFWEQGFEGASFDDLTSTMGINPSSFYNAFGSKELLYKEALQYYLDSPSEWFSRALSEEQDVRIAFERLVESTATEFTRDDLPAGCMISLAGTHVPPSLDSLRDTMISYRSMAEKMMAERLKQGVKQGQISINDRRRSAGELLWNGLSRDGRASTRRQVETELAENWADGTERLACRSNDGPPSLKKPPASTSDRCSRARRLRWHALRGAFAPSIAGCAVLFWLAVPTKGPCH
jgi:AcrR family transcriptional regulator